MIYSKKEKKELINKLLKKIEKVCKITGLSKNSLANIIRTFHYSSPFFLIFFVAYGPLPFVISSVIFVCLIYFFFFKFRGCILSRIESEMLEDDFCITDPTLEICRMKITNKNRYKISYIVGTTFLLIFILIIYMRFFRKK
jgi:hypothetical protein